MKLMVVTVEARDARCLRDALVDAGLEFTELASSAGLLREGRATSLIGVADEQVDGVIELVRRHCQQREEMVNVSRPETRLFGSPIAAGMPVTVGGAHIMVLDVERMVTV